METNSVRYYIKATVDCPDPTMLSLADGRIGAIYPRFGLVNQKEWLECDGQAVSRALYPALFALIGTRFGQGDGETTFNLPRFRTTAYLS